LGIRQRTELLCEPLMHFEDLRYGLWKGWEYGRTDAEYRRELRVWGLGLQDHALQTTFSVFLDIFYPQILAILRKMDFFITHAIFHH
jgi:hypothetical protein